MAKKKTKKVQRRRDVMDLRMEDGHTMTPA